MPPPAPPEGNSVDPDAKFAMNMRYHKVPNLPDGAALQKGWEATHIMPPVYTIAQKVELPETKKIGPGEGNFNNSRNWSCRRRRRLGGVRGMIVIFEATWGEGNWAG
jgi:hypothetical protein